MDFEENIKNWLMDEECLIEKKFDENADFHYIIEFPKDNIMDVVKPVGKDCIIIACATQVAQEHVNLMVASRPEVRRNFILDLQFGLNSYLVDFELSINQDLLQQFVVTDTIFEDGFHPPIKTICSFNEGEVHFKYKLFEGILRLKRYISSVNT